MAFHFRTNICFYFLLSLLMVAFSGCIEKQDVFTISYFAVSGGIYDASAETQDSPIEGVTVNITGYSVQDLDRTSPVYSGKCVSASDGSYQFSINSVYNLGEFYFVFTVKDEATYRSEHFEQTERKLFLSTNSSFYNSFMKTYEVKDNDFYLYPEKR